MVDFEQEMDDEVAAAVAAIGHKRVHVILSYSDDTDDDGNPTRNNLHDIAIVGKCVVFRERDSFWAGVKSRSYMSEVMENPTWLQIAVCTNTMIRRTKDKHHCFLEGVYEITDKEFQFPRKFQQKVEQYAAEGIKIYRLSMGS